MMVFIPRSTSFRDVCADSTLTYSARRPWARRSAANWSKAVVLPVWRGACSTKYFDSAMSAPSRSSPTRPSGGMQ